MINIYVRDLVLTSRILTKAEGRYCVTDKELLGVYFAVRKCEFYLIGHMFVVYTDHEPLIHLKAFRNLVEKRFRWINYLETVNTIIRYIPGKENVIGDYISRNIRAEEHLRVIVHACMNLFNHDVDEFRVAQLNDVDIHNVINNINNKSGEIPKSFQRHRNKLMYVFHPRAAKFEICWIGPYEVVKQKHPLT